MQGGSGWDRESHLMFDNLPKGEYLIYVEIDWNKSTEDTDFCVSCYGASKSFYIRDEKSLYDKCNLLRKAYASKAKQMLPGVTVQNYADKGASKINKYKSF